MRALLVVSLEISSESASAYLQFHLKLQLKVQIRKLYFEFYLKFQLNVQVLYVNANHSSHWSLQTKLLSNGWSASLAVSLDNFKFARKKELNSLVILALKILAINSKHILDHSWVTENLNIVHTHIDAVVVPHSKIELLTHMAPFPRSSRKGLPFVVIQGLPLWSRKGIPKDLEIVPNIFSGRSWHVLKYLQTKKN